MPSKLRILLLEDSVADAVLIEHELEASGLPFSLTRVDTEADFCRELNTTSPDLILSDHGLPEFDGFKALEIVRDTRPQLPFIFVSGSNDQGMVVEMFEQGATDYVFKRDLEDLRSAVKGALAPAPEELASGKPKPRPDPAQPELGLHVSQPSPIPAPPPVVGHLWFCPRCRRTRDQSGWLVSLGEYFNDRSEIVVNRQICRECREPHWWK